MFWIFLVSPKYMILFSRFVVVEVANPVIACLAIFLAVPYVVAHSIVPLFVHNAFLRVVVARRIYPSVLVLAAIIGLVSFQVRSLVRQNFPYP